MINISGKSSFLRRGYLKKQSQFKLVPSSSSGQALRGVEWTQLLRSAYKSVWW